MKSLEELDYTVQMAVPEAAGEAVKAWHAGTARSDQQILAYQFVVHILAGVDQLGFALPGDPDVMAWRNGRRFVGLQIERIVREPAEAASVEPPRARTMTESARRRRGE